MSWNDAEAKGTTWDQMAIPSTEHEGGLRLRKPNGGDVLPAPFDPSGIGAIVRWLVLEPQIDEAAGAELATLARRTWAGATPQGLLAALPAAWLAYQRGER